MILQKQHYNKSTLRFRRWSRANYAMFVSMGVCVTIGFLSDSIVEKSVSKTSKMITEFFESHSKIESDQNELSLESALFTEQLNEILMSENSSDYTAAEFHKYFTRTVEKVTKKSFQPFFNLSI